MSGWEFQWHAGDTNGWVVLKNNTFVWRVVQHRLKSKVSSATLEDRVNSSGQMVRPGCFPALYLVCAGKCWHIQPSLKRFRKSTETLIFKQSSVPRINFMWLTLKFLRNQDLSHMLTEPPPSPEQLPVAVQRYNLWHRYVKIRFVCVCMCVIGQRAGQETRRGCPIHMVDTPTMWIGQAQGGKAATPYAFHSGSKGICNWFGESYTTSGLWSISEDWCKLLECEAQQLGVSCLWLVRRLRRGRLLWKECCLARALCFGGYFETLK